jgi:hypothetical protein
LISHSERYQFFNLDTHFSTERKKHQSLSLTFKLTQQGVVNRDTRES